MNNDIPPTLDREVRLRHTGSVLTCRVGSDTVLLDSAAGRYYSLDEVGTRIFELVGAGRTLGDIHAILVDTYEAGPDRLWSDLIEFCGRMSALGMFVRQDA